MKNKKLLKVLATVTLGGTAAIGLALAGCSHTHTWKTDDWKDSDTHHWHETNCGHDVTPEESDGYAAHNYGENGKDQYCLDCHHLNPDYNAGGNGGNGGDGETTEKTPLAKPVLTLTEKVITWEAVPNATAYEVYEGETKVADVATTADLKYTITQTTAGTYSYTVKAIGDADYSDSVSEAKSYTVTGSSSEETSYSVTFDMHGIGTAPAAQTVDKDGNATAPDTAPSATGYYFVGWYTDETYTTEFDFANTAITADTTVYACWSEDIVSNVTIPTVQSNTALTENVTIGKVTFSAGGRWEANNLYNTQGKYIEFELTGSTNSVSFTARGASSSGCAISFVKVEGETETVIKAYDSVANNIYVEGSDTTPITIGNLAAGTYRLKAAASFRANNISISERLVVSDPDSIKVTPAVVDFVIGSEFSSEGLGTVLHYKNGREDVITNVSINKDAYKKDVAGKYPITVSYTLEGSTTPFTDTYYVYVYQVDSISLKTNATVQGGSSPAGNGLYVNHAAQQVYFVGDTLNLDGYTVHLASSVTVEGEAKKEKLFRYTPVATDFTGFSTATAGVKAVTLTAYGHTDEFEVLVMADPELSKASAVSIVVSQNLDNADVQDMLKESFDTQEDIVAGGCYSGKYVFATIKQALDFMENANLDKNATKTLLLDKGTYNEKLEINIPNLTIQGGNILKMGESSYNHRQDVIIEWDSLYGVADESGYVQTTDSSATLNVRAAAEGFQIKNVTISNWYNSEEHFQEKLGIGYSEHRALAMLIQADKVIVDDCVLLGYQDTIQLFTGRQIIKNSYISGTTDFIFGSNNTTYFDNCEIHSIARWKKALGEDGKPVFETDGGYITAFKGCNKGESDYVTYGAIFNKCNFTADEGVAEHNTAIARPWGAYAAVAVINSKLGIHIATTSTGEASKNERYVTMSTNKPTDSTVKFKEYNNTGAGAITEEVKGMKLLSESEADDYSNFDVIFDKTNGGVRYADFWSGNLQLVPVTITLGEKTATIYGYYGGTLSQTAIDQAVEGLIDEGRALDTLTCNGQAFTAETPLLANSIQVTATDKESAGKILSALTTNADDLTGTTFAANSVVNWDKNGIIKLHSEADKMWTMDSNSKAIKDADGKTLATTANRLKSNGAKSYITIDLSEYAGDYKITLSFAPSGDSERTINFAEIDATGEVVGSAIYTEALKTKDAQYKTCDIVGGKVYKIYFTGNAFNFYGIHISPVAD